MQGTGNTHGGHGSTRDGAQQRATQRVAERVAEARLERLDGEAGALRIQRFLGKSRTLCNKHCGYPFSLNSVVHSPVRRFWMDLVLLSAQTRRRFGGRTPLWACGVTSVMEPTSRPADCRERMAVSRPEPGPLTNTSTFLTPCSIALRAADSAAIPAAYGVDLREPLKRHRHPDARTPRRRTDR